MATTSNVPRMHFLQLNHPALSTLDGIPPDDFPLGDWYLMCTIEKISPWLRPVYDVLDTSGRSFTLGFYITPDNTVKVANFAPGTVLCFHRPFKHYFMGGQIGLRVEDDDLEDMFHIPFGLDELNRLNEYLLKNEVKCKYCGKEGSLSRCTRCKVPYCSTECQAKDWKSTHRKQCKSVAHLREMNDVIIDDPKWADYGLRFDTSGSESEDEKEEN